MPSFRSAIVERLISSRHGLQRVTVRFDDPAQSGDKAYVLTGLIGTVSVGDRVVVNTTAVDLGLGTGGWHVVHWNLSTERFVQPGPEHIMKMRYTSLQSDVGAAELVASVEADGNLSGVPVLVCGLHSLAGVVACAARWLRPTVRIAYVMTDGAALPLALSDMMFELRSRGIVDTTITAGNAFGGDYETVSVASALGIAANVVSADVIVVAMGPGMVGTGSMLGTSAVEVAHHLDDANASGGTPILVPRVSFADQRPRHRGISHHSVTAAARSYCTPLVPDLADLGVDISTFANNVSIVSPAAAIDAGTVLHDLDMRITSMGRGIDADPAFYSAAARSAAIAVELERPAGGPP